MLWLRIIVEKKEFDTELLKETVIVYLSHMPTVCVKNPDRHEGDGMTVDTPMKPIFTFSENYEIKETYYTREYFCWCGINIFLILYFIVQFTTFNKKRVL